MIFFLKLRKLQKIKTLVDFLLFTNKDATDFLAGVSLATARGRVLRSKFNEQAA